MSKHSRLSSSLSLRGRESARRRRDRELKVESLEPRLALATGLLSTLVSIRDDAGQRLLAPGATAAITEGQELTAQVRLTRRPDSAILVSLKSLAPLEVGAAPTTLRFTKANWNQPQAVSLRSLQDNVRDGDSLVPVKLITTIERSPQSQATKKIWVESLDSHVAAAATPVTATHRGSLMGGGTSGSVTGSYDSVANRGTVTLKVTMPQLNKVRDRVITVGYSLGPDNQVQIESLSGITASQFRWDMTYRELGTDRGLFGTVTVLQPQLGKSATAMMTAAAVPEAVQDLAVAPTGVGSLLLSWNPPAGGATGYTVTMTATTTSYVSGTRTTTTNTTTSTTTATSMPFTGLSATPSYTFTVVATNAGGSGATTAAHFGAQTVTVGLGPSQMAKGLDGSIWVICNTTVQQIVKENGIWVARSPITVVGNATGITVGRDGSIWVASTPPNAQNTLPGSVQQIVQQNGAWVAQNPITVGSYPTSMTTGLDGSIWVANINTNTVQQVVNSGGTWAAQPAISLGSNVASNYMGIATGLDGSIWVCNAETNTVQQITQVNGVWTAQSGITVTSPVDLTVGTDGAIWVICWPDNPPFYIQRIVEVDGTWTPQPAINVGNTTLDGSARNYLPYQAVTAPDGSIWVANFGYVSTTAFFGSVQQVASIDGTWTALPTIQTPQASSESLLLADDGSIWINNTLVPNGEQGVYNFPAGSWIWLGMADVKFPKTVPGSTIEQAIGAPSPPNGLSATVGPASGEITLAWRTPSANGTPIVSYTVTAYQGTTSQTITTASTSCTFSGLPTGQGPTYFTVTASNFAGTSGAGSLLLGPDGNPVASANAATGVVTDGTAFSGGGFDGKGNAYSWQSLGSSQTLPWNGVSFTLGSPNQPNCVVANGQTIPMQQGTGTTLNLAGAAVNGNQQNQQITLTFTDNSTVVWTQSFSDWGSPQNYGHEAIITKESYRDTSTGGSTTTSTNVYGYSYTIPSGKTLASITLPTNSNVRLLDIQMSTATSVDLSSGYSSWGIANGQTQVANQQGFDGGGYYYYSAQLGPLVAWSGATFNFGTVPTSSKGGNNFVQAKGQSITLPQGSYSWLYLAGAGANGGQTNQNLTLTFSDGSTATWTQSFSDWCSPSGYSGETIIQQQSSRVNQVGNVHSQTNYVYGYAYQIPVGKTLTSITLPNNKNNVGILGMAMM